MKILFVTHYPGFGGANQSCLHLARLLKVRHKIDSIILTPFAGPIQDACERNGIRCDTLRYASWRGPRTGVIGLFYAFAMLFCNIIAVARALWRYRHEKIDIVHCNSSLAFFGWLYGKIARIPIVWHLREYGTDDYPMSFYLGRSLSGIIFGTANVVIAISEDIRRFYSSFIRPQDKINIVYNGIDTTLIEKNKESDDDLQSSFKGVKVAYIGGINRTKNPHEIIRALKYLKETKKLGDIYLYMIGDGIPEDKDEFTRLVAESGLEDRVYCLGFRVNVWPILSKMDFAIVPSIREAFGRVAVECMLCGLPVIASKAGALPEIIDSGSNGFTFELGDVDNLASLILWLSVDKELRKSMSDKARKVANEKFSAQLNADRVAEIYKRIVQ